MNMILKREEGLDLDIVTYRVIPTSTKGGFIEIVPDSETICRINSEMNFTILNFIMEHNGHQTVEEIRNRFLRSTAAYCVITYLLGIGDRHLDNIMITKTGALFHIDFGFILGYDPKPLAPQMRITPEMVDAIGGQNSVNYKKFKKLCAQIFNCLRRHANLFMNLLSLLPEASPPIDHRDTKFTMEQLEEEIINRFMPGYTYEEAELQLSVEMDKSQGNSMIDMFHVGNRETLLGSQASAPWEFLTSLPQNLYYTLFNWTGRK